MKPYKTYKAEFCALSNIHWPNSVNFKWYGIVFKHLILEELSFWKISICWFLSWLYFELLWFYGFPFNHTYFICDHIFLFGDIIRIYRLIPTDWPYYGKLIIRLSWFERYWTWSLKQGFRFESCRCENRDWEGKYHCRWLVGLSDRIHYQSHWIFYNRNVIIEKVTTDYSKIRF